MAKFVDVNPLPRHPVFTPRQAVAYAKGEVTAPDKDYTAYCLHFCAWVYGFKSSGVRSAADFWRATPASLKSEGDRKPPVGALACWLGGSKGFGHISIVVGYSKAGEAMVASNDIKRKGKIDIVTLSLIEKAWGQKYVGWAKPYFPFGTPDERKAPDMYADDDSWGKVYQDKLVAGQKSSKSVRRLQKRLGLKPTGNYNQALVDRSAKWQERHGYKGNGKAWTTKALDELFGSHYFVIKEK